jgi:hypothetical protein
MTTSRLERFRQLAQRHGLCPAMATLLSRAASRCATLNVGRLLWLEAERISPPPPSESGFCYRLLTAEELPRFAVDPTHELDPGFAERLRRGHDFCFAALAGPQLAAYAWFALRSIEPEHCGGVTLSFPADVAYTYKGFTRPEFRGLGLYGQVISQGLRGLAGHGVDKLLASVEWTNWASLKSCYRLGYVDLGPLVALGRGRWRIVVPPKAARRRGIRFGRSAELRSKS